MNKQLLTRLFRSIEGNKSDDIVKVAYTIIENENEQGHEKLATHLKSILESNLNNYKNYRNELKRILPEGVSIPTDKRNNLPLATEIERDKLRHEMVLNPDIEEKIARIEKEFVARERLAHFGLKPRQKILLYGSSGCGKSMSAERIAWNIGLPFLKVRFEAIISSYLGESANNLKVLFESLRAFPCVLLLDEFDFIAKSRTSSQEVGEMHRIVNILLNLMEEYDASGLVIATTNLEGMIDKALFRRFDDVIEITRPQEQEIAQILENTLSAIHLNKDVKLNEIAKEMIGFSAALTVKVANDAAKLAIISGKSEVGLTHFKKSLSENKAYNN
ncbi:MAG: ATP-binding protein [Arcicella sp.]|jgi:SpoVK/Ycf46/Vps4 family AAA+-type ATPase|nr:ATP-binding protein [Arcicella sp.]